MENVDNMKDQIACFCRKMETLRKNEMGVLETDIKISFNCLISRTNMAIRKRENYFGSQKI